MIILNIKKTYECWIEATWINREIVEQIVKKEVDGKEIEETVENIVDTQLWCESFSGHPEHIAMFRAKALEYNSSLDEYESLISEIQSNTVPYVSPALTEQDFTIAIQTHLDTTAQKTKWDNMQSARSCAGIPLDGTETDIEVAMHDDAVKLARWYLKVWAYGYAQLDLINKGEREVPVSVEAFIAELPLLN